MNGEQKTILVMEDDESLLEAIEHQFTTRGFKVLTSKNVDEGLDRLESSWPIDIIWLDHYLLGRTNGLDFVVKIKNHPVWRNIPIFVVSNSSGVESIQSYMRLGVDQYYTKADYDLGQIIKDIEYTLTDGENIP